MSFGKSLNNYGKQMFGGSSDQSWSAVARQRVAKQFGVPTNRKKRSLNDYGTATPAPSASIPASPDDEEENDGGY